MKSVGRNRDRGDWALEEDIFRELHNLCGFTCELCRDEHGDNWLLPAAKGYTKSDSLFNHNLDGLTVWGNCVFQQIPKVLAHYLRCKETAVQGVSAMFVVPDHYASRPKVQELLQQAGLKLFKTYPAGSQLFTAAPSTPGGPRRRCRPVHFPVHLFTDIEVALQTGLLPTCTETIDCNNPQADALETQPAVQTVDTVQTQADNADEHPNEPASNALQNPTPSVQAASKLLVCSAYLGGKLCSVCLDPGATNSFVDTGFAESRDLEITPAHGSVAGALKAGPAGITGTMQAVIKLRNFRQSHAFVVTQLANYDVILGKDWFDRNSKIIQVNWAENLVTLTPRYGRVHLTCKGSDDVPEATAQHVRLVGAAEFRRLASSCPRAEVFACTILPVEPAANNVEVSTESGGQEEHWPDALKQLLAEFQDITQAEFDLPPYRDVNCRVDEEPGVRPTCPPSWRMTPLELAETQKQVSDSLKRGLLRNSSSPYGAPILFVRKADGSLRMCIDYRALNNQTIKDKFPLPRIDDLLDRLTKARIFSKLDLAQGYHQMRMEPGHEHKTAFRTPFGLYEWTVMPFGLTNAPAQFQRLMNSVLQDCVTDNYVVVYLDDIMIYSETEQEHIEHLRTVFTKLREQKLYLRLKKCSFFQSTVKYLGFIVSKGTLRADPAKFDAIRNWPQPVSKTEIMSFLGLAGQYRKFIHHYSELTTPLTNLLSKDKPNKPKWTDVEQKAFDRVKYEVTNAPVLRLPDPDKPFVLETDASDVGLGAVLLQPYEDGLHPVAFASKKLLPAEKNYLVHERELLAGVWALKQWRCYIEGKAFTWKTDNESLKWLQTQRELNKRQTRWVQWLQTFDYSVQHIAGKQNAAADALSRRPDFTLSLNGLQLLALTTTTDFLNQVVECYDTDAWLQDPANLTRLTWTGRYWFVGKHLYVPAGMGLREALIAEAHDVESGHAGVEKTTSTLLRRFWWPHLHKQVTHFVRTCGVCQTIKPSNLKPAGLVNPLPVPTRRWQSIASDLITDLPNVRGYDCIVVFIDRLTRYTVLIPCKKTITSQQYARLFYEHIVCKYGLPDEIITDRDPRFTAGFWETFLKTLGTEIKLSTAYHPQTDGLTERVNRTMQQFLRAFCADLPRKWLDNLPVAQAAYNSTSKAFSYRVHS